MEREIQAGLSAWHPKFNTGFVQFHDLATPLSALVLAHLDPGEAAVIQLAIDYRIERVCIDERKGRRASLAVGLEVTGSLGLLARAKKTGLLPAIKPLVEKMSAHGEWFDSALLQRVHDSVGE